MSTATPTRPNIGVGGTTSTGIGYDLPREVVTRLHRAYGRWSPTEVEGLAVSMMTSDVWVDRGYWSTPDILSLIRHVLGSEKCSDAEARDCAEYAIDRAITRAEDKGHAAPFTADGAARHVLRIVYAARVLALLAWQQVEDDWSNDQGVKTLIMRMAAGTPDDAGKPITLDSLVGYVTTIRPPRPAPTAARVTARTTAKTTTRVTAPSNQPDVVAVTATRRASGAPRGRTHTSAPARVRIAPSKAPEQAVKKSPKPRFTSTPRALHVENEVDAGTWASLATNPLNEVVDDSCGRTVIATLIAGGTRRAYVVTRT